MSQNDGLQRCVFYVILISCPILILADWTTTWPSYSPSPQRTKRWSPAQAISERVNQLGFCIIEIGINFIYMVCLIRILRVKSSVRQRRVMWDLIFVTTLSSMFDILNVILLYTNRTGISHPIQTFSYALKLRLEFIVLNQLMAVAARGWRQETYAEKRYHHPSVDAWGSTMQPGLDSHPKESEDNNKTKNQLGYSAQASACSPQNTDPLAPASADTIPSTPSIGDDSRQTKPSVVELMPRMAHPRRRGSGEDQHAMMPVGIKMRKMKKQRNGLWRNDEDEPEEEKVGLHQWERKGHQPVLAVPWFRDAVDGV